MTKRPGRELFQAACEHRETWRAPIDYQAHPEVDRRLRGHFKVESEEELLDCLGCDFFYLPGRDISQNEGFTPYYVGPRLEQTATERICPLGIRWRRGAGTSKFAVDEAIAGPFEGEAASKQILGHRWPKPADFDFSALESVCQSHADRVLIGGLWTGILGDSYRMCGFQQFLMNLALKPDVIHSLVDRMTEMYLELNDAVFSLLQGKLDVWFFGNDFGHQKGLLMSVDMWADFFLENIRRLCNLAHGHGLRVMMHSCGSVARLIPLLVEAGVDILDPVQVSARDMQPETLKNAFGPSIVFHGGIDTQHVLPKGSAADCRRHALSTLRILGHDGGYIFAPSQIYQPDIPVENIVAVYEVAKDPRVNGHEARRVGLGC